MRKLFLILTLVATTISCAEEESAFDLGTEAADTNGREYWICEVICLQTYSCSFLAGGHMTTYETCVKTPIDRMMWDENGNDPIEIYQYFEDECAAIGGTLASSWEGYARDDKIVYRSSSRVTLDQACRRL